MNWLNPYYVSPPVAVAFLAVYLPLAFFMLKFYRKTK